MLMSFFVLGFPKLDTVHQCWYVLPNTAQYAASFHLIKGNALFVLFAVHCEPRSPLLKTAFQPVSAQSVLLHGVITAQVQDFALVFPKLHEASVSSLLQSVEGHLSGNLTLQYIDYSPQFHIACDLTKGGTHPSTQIVRL